MSQDKLPAVYLMADRFRGVIYVGVTSNLVQRDYQHKHGILPGFTKKHGCQLLVWYEVHETMESAILREKQLKGGSRQRKMDLIEARNPFWHDVSAEIQS